MKAGKITAKLRDAVPVCFMVDGEEVKRYPNIEIPDSLKELEMLDFRFNVHMDGKITFEIHFEEGVLPEVFPEPRTRMTRAAKAAAKAAAQAAPVEIREPEDTMEEPESITTEEAPADMVLRFNVTGISRKQLVIAVSEYTGAEPTYKAAPSFAYEIGAYTVDKEGTLTGPANLALAEALQRQGFVTAE